MADILSSIRDYKMSEIETMKRTRAQADVERDARSAPAVRRFAAAIAARVASKRPALIAEVKKASPSKGVIREVFDPVAIASAYAAAGAVCLSVLTDRPSFQGAPEHLTSVRSACELPVLCKEFMFDPYQVFVARSWGADCILIILAAVDDKLAQELEAAASSVGMDVLLEVHNEAELERAQRHLHSRLIGVNNRDLKTFEASLATTLRLARLVDPQRVVVSESGISGYSDVERLASEGVHAYLVGETLMRADDIAAATRALIGFEGASSRALIGGAP